MSDEPFGTPARVLICDDNDMIRSLLRRVIETSAALQVVGEAADGHEAIAEATRLQPDLITLDIAMPNLSGLDALPALRRAAPHARVVVFSGFASVHVADEVIALGAACYLEKGASKETIVAALEQALVPVPALAASSTRHA
jgi:DNA-binding NarL/FixJ family response regulator